MLKFDVLEKVVVICPDSSDKLLNPRLLAMYCIHSPRKPSTAGPAWSGYISGLFTGVTIRQSPPLPGTRIIVGTLTAPQFSSSSA